MDVTERRLLQDLFDKLVILQSQQAAYRALMELCDLKDRQSGRLVDWATTLGERLALIQSIPPRKVYEDIQSKLHSSTLEYPEAIRLMIEMADRTIVVS